jgi:hygromycin-B 7''-O-kinase
MLENDYTCQRLGALRSPLSGHQFYMMHGLPKLTDMATFRAWRADPSQWLPTARDIARAHGLSDTNSYPFLTGTNLVVGLDGLILKIFPPMLRAQFISERASLAQLRGRLRVPIPEIALEGERDGWPYLVITRLRGMLGAEAWPTLPEDQKERVLGQIGETIAEVQRVPIGELSRIEPGWGAFMQQQIEGCPARHRGLGLPPKYWEELDEIVGDATALVPMNAAPVILTGEYIPENFLLSRESGAWQLSGLIDFGDVLTGWGEYDLLGPSAFMTAGIPRRVRSLFSGYGYSPVDVTPALRRRLMALLLLHRFSDPIRHVCIEGWQQKTQNLSELAELLWPV